MTRRTELRFLGTGRRSWNSCGPYRFAYVELFCTHFARGLVLCFDGPNGLGLILFDCVASNLGLCGIEI